MKGVGASNGIRFFADVFGRPAAHQLAKHYTRGKNFSLEKYAFDVVKRGLAFGMPGDMKPLFRGLMSGYYDSVIKGKSDTDGVYQFDHAYAN